jgi:CheY-like chemotaxis protein
MSGKKRVLIVANDPSDIWTIGQSMIRDGFSVTATTCGSDGFRQLERNQFDYLIVDGTIQEVSLFTFLAYCRRYFSETKTIVLTDSSLERPQEKEPIAGANYCVPNPVSLEVISNIISGMDVDKSPAGVIY